MIINDGLMTQEVGHRQYISAISYTYLTHIEEMDTKRAITCDSTLTLVDLTSFIKT